MGLFHKIRFDSLKEKIHDNPGLGQKQEDSTYIYKEGDYSIRYRMINDARSAGGEIVQVLAEKRRLNSYEEWSRRLSRRLRHFFLGQGWFVLLRPQVAVLLLVSFAVFYFGFVETQGAKASRFKWIVSEAIGVAPDEVEYIGGGWLDVSAQRKIDENKLGEPIKYRFNPIQWLFSSQRGYINRWDNRAKTYAVQPVVYNDRGDIWVKKTGQWQHGQIRGNSIKWDVPQIKDLQGNKIGGHEISTQDKKLYITDK